MGHFFPSPLKVPTDSLFEPEVIDGRCGLDCQGQNAAAMQLFLIDNKENKCHSRHLEIDGVRHSTRKCTLLNSVSQISISNFTSWERGSTG